MIFPLVCFCLLFLVSPAVAEEALLPFNHSPWDQFLKKVVNEKGEVNYARAQKESELLEAYFEKLKSIPNKDFESWPREERMAIYINAYNAGVIRRVLQDYPVKTVMDIPGFWDQAAIQIGSEAQSLNLIQNSILRGQFRDEKALFALCSGAKGSPQLRPEAYVGPRVDGQLYLAARDFVNDESKNRIKPGEEKIFLSRLFKWNATDFLLNWSNFPEESRWNPQEMAVLSFLAHYLEDSKKVEFLREGEYKVKYADFDWHLNDAPL